MSLCRFSTLLPNGKLSDVYVYHSVYGGWDVLVAQDRTDLGKFAGQHRNYRSSAQARRFLAQIRKLGFLVPDWLFDRKTWGRK